MTTRFLKSPLRGKLIALCMCLLPCLSSCSEMQDYDNTPVAAVDLSRFLGNWYEIARFDHCFERGMTHCKANYTASESGTIRVTNKGLKKGKWRTSKGKAKITDTPGLIRVSFFGPFYSDYRILMLADDYSYALIGSNSKKYLWILSRTPSLSSDIQAAILVEATHRGYDTDKLIWVEQ